MSIAYKVVQWNKTKKIYNRYLWVTIGLLIVSFVGFQLALHPTTTVETLLIRSSALVAAVLLHFVLVIGPLCRIAPVFLPLLYNRRHLGVTMFFFAAIHGVFSLIQFHALGNIGVLESLFTANSKYNQINAFPFQVLGFFALIVLFFMAVTSHDFWLKNLSPRIWKLLHINVYIAYGLIILHIALGVLQYNTHPVYWILLLSGFVVISGLHICASLKSVYALVKDKKRLQKEGFYKVCGLHEIAEDCGHPVFIKNQNIALFKHKGQVYGVSNVCKHQMGPLGEGQIVNGCITCPWHGYQYYPHNGQSPPPFNEKLSTYKVKVVKDSIWLNPTPYQEGTAIDPTKNT